MVGEKDDRLIGGNQGKDGFFNQSIDATGKSHLGLIRGINFSPSQPRKGIAFGVVTGIEAQNTPVRVVQEEAGCGLLRSFCSQLKKSLLRA